jgi:pimeloyl-ACP methyl ester carboxylesterase
MRFVFLPGGPGLNSFAEQAILGPLFDAGGYEIVFWNEPSRLRSGGDAFERTGAFECWLASAEALVLSAARLRPIHLLAHSITIHAAVDIVRRHPDCVATLVAVAPSADSFATFTNVLALAHEDLTDTKPDVASAIADSLARTRTLMDEPMRQGLMNVLQDDRLFTHYWADPAQFDASMSAMARPDAQFDAESFFAVLGGFAHRGGTCLTGATVTLPTLVLFGDRDRITPMEQQRTIQAAIPGARLEVMGGCSHYLHLDRPQAFMNRVVDWAAGSR